MITVRDHLGRRAFAFAPASDPFAVLAAVAWAYAEGRHPVCTSWPGWGCPATEGGYCLDCHCEAQAALDEARRREPAMVSG